MRAWSILPALRLIRITNLPSPIADQVAAAAVVTGGALPWHLVGLLGAASACLYHGGMALNDFADREEDARDRPERPIPSGQIAPVTALGIGLGLLAAGVALAGIASPGSELLAGALALAILAYDFRARRYPPLAPWVMGLCRTGNWLLVPAARCAHPGLDAPLVPLALAGLYGLWIAAVTGLARYEVGGLASRSFARRARLLAAIPFLSLAFLRAPIAAAPLLILLAAGFEWAIRRRAAGPSPTPRALSPQPPVAQGLRVRQAVGWAVRGTLLLDAALAAGSGAEEAALVLLGVFLAAAPLARRIPVT